VETADSVHRMACAIVWPNTYPELARFPRCQWARYNQPVILLTDMVVEDFEMALQIRNRFTRRWDCETSIEFRERHAATDIR
ncbi:MAG: hypothetical protein ACETWQ_11310, partial [Phycisphaerae bacterium]